MNMEEASKTGVLLIPPQSFLRKHWNKRYCALYNSSNHGIQRIEIFESEDAYVKQNPSKIVPLTDCIKVIPAPQKNQPNVFEVRTKNSSYQFSADTFQDMQDWLLSLQNVAFGKHQSKILSVVKDEKQEENMLYSSMDEPEVYTVTAVATDATVRNNLKGDYKLIITAVNLSIAEDNPQGRIGRIILTWPYRHIRRYGCSTENFSFEAGRKCASGEGLFTFSTNDGMLIFQSVDAHVVALKSSQNEGEIPNSPSLNEDKNSFFTSKDSLVDRKSLPYQHGANKFDSVFTMISGNENETPLQTFKNKQSVAKPFPPLMKPPRKSKISKATDVVPANLPTNDALSKESKYCPNVYEELYRTSSSDNLSFQCDHSVGFSEYSKINFQKPNSSVITKEDEFCSGFEKLQVCDKVKKESYTEQVSSSDYTNCDLLSQDKNTFPDAAISDDHVYGKLLNKRQSTSSKAVSSVYGSLHTKNTAGPEAITSPIYSNVPSLEKSLNKVAQDDAEREPKHFIHNDAEYAQVLKKCRNLSH